MLPIPTRRPLSSAFPQLNPAHSSIPPPLPTSLATPIQLGFPLEQELPTPKVFSVPVFSVVLHPVVVLFSPIAPAYSEVVQQLVSLGPLSVRSKKKARKRIVETMIIWERGMEVLQLIMEILKPALKGSKKKQKYR